MLPFLKRDKEGSAAMEVEIKVRKPDHEEEHDDTEDQRGNRLEDEHPLPAGMAPHARHDMHDPARQGAADHT